MAEHTVPAPDRRLHATDGRLALGLSPASATAAYLDWVCVIPRNEDLTIARHAARLVVAEVERV